MIRIEGHRVGHGRPGRRTASAGICIDAGDKRTALLIAAYKKLYEIAEPPSSRLGIALRYFTNHQIAFVCFFDLPRRADGQRHRREVLRPYRDDEESCGAMSGGA